MEPLDVQEDHGFEDHSLSTELERLTFAVEQAVAKWFLAILLGQHLPGEIKGHSREMINAAEGNQL